MSLLDDAQRLLLSPATAYWDSVPVGTVGRLGPDMGTVLKCGHCKRQVHDHADGCPVLALPKIVAALAVLEYYADRSIWAYGSTVRNGQPVDVSPSVLRDDLGDRARAALKGETA